MTNKPVPFVWHDLVTTDVEAAKVFYAQVIGWSMQSFPGNDDYTVLSAGDTGVGGIMAIPLDACARGAPACWQGYIAVDDVDACADRILSSGGAIIRAPTSLPKVGRFALVADPQGAVFIIFKPESGDAATSPAPTTPGVVGWNYHQRQQRAILRSNVVQERVDQVGQFYLTEDRNFVQDFLAKYEVSYIVFGQLERLFYPGAGLEKFEQWNGIIWDEVFRYGSTVIYQVRR